MEHEQTTIDQIVADNQPPQTPGRDPAFAAIWLPVSVLSGLAIGWIATQVGMRFAPLVIFPLIVGIVLGVCLVGMMRLLQTGHRATFFSAALLSASIAVGSQHYYSYLDANRRMEQSQLTRKAQAAFAEMMLDRLPDGPLDYLRRQAALGRPMPFGWVARGPMAWLSWLVDGLLVIAATMAVVIFAGGPKETNTQDHQRKEISCPT